MSYQVTRPKLPGRVLIGLGVLALVVGLAGGATLLVAARQRFDARVKSLATDSAALSGCITDLTFARQGTFVLYYLFEGTVAVNGANDGCATAGRVMLHADPRPAAIDVKLTNNDGVTVPSSPPTRHVGTVFRRAVDAVVEEGVDVQRSLEDAV